MEEVFTIPHLGSAEGIVRGTLPLVVNGEIIEDFSITFQQGRVVSATAKLDIDEGSPRLGEVQWFRRAHRSPAKAVCSTTRYSTRTHRAISHSAGLIVFPAKWRPVFHCGIHRCWRESEPSPRGFHDRVERARHRRAEFRKERRSDYQGRLIGGNSLCFS